MNDYLGEREKATLRSAVDYVKLTTTAAAGALVLSLSLLPNAPTYSSFERGLLITSWCLFAVSAISGSFVLTNVPFFVASVERQRGFILEQEIIYRWPTIITQLSLVFGALCMGVGLGHAFVSTSSFSSFAVRDGRAAVAVAEKALPSPAQVRKLNKVEVVRGLDSSRGEDMIWDVQFEVDDPAPSVSKGRRMTRRTIDVIVGPDGKALVVEPAVTHRP